MARSGAGARRKTGHTVSILEAGRVSSRGALKDWEVFDSAGTARRWPLVWVAASVALKGMPLHPF